MTMNYCGRCGSVNGARALFCRQCGTELSNQTTISAPSAPLNVEFSAKPVVRDIIPEEPKAVAPAENTEAEKSVNIPEPGTGDSSSDPVSISRSLRKVRASGPLIIEASRKREQQMNQIIAQAIGKDEPKPGSGKLTTQQGDSDSTMVESGRVESTTDKLSSRSEVSGPPENATNRGTPVYAHAGSGNLRGGSAPFHGSGNLPPNTPSSVLAQASGLKPNSGIGSRLRIILVSLAVILAMLTYFMFRDRLLTPNLALDADRDLMRVEDQSSKLVRLGERDLEHGKFDQAIEYFQRALTLTPHNPNVHYLLGQAHLSAGQTDEAMKVYQSLLRLAPERLEARLRVAEIHRLRNNWNAAYTEYQRIIALDQNSVQAALALEAIEEHQAGDSLSASSSRSTRRSRNIRDSLLVLPKESNTQAPIALLQQRNLNAPLVAPPAAVTGNDSGDNPDPRMVAETRKKLGLRYLNVREFRASINEFLAALRLTPDDKDIYYFLGTAYYGLGQHALAHDYYRRVDSGQYVQVAQSGAQRTEKAAREEYKRRMEMLRNEPNNEKNGEAPSNKTIFNAFKQ